MLHFIIFATFSLIKDASTSNYDPIYCLHILDSLFSVKDDDASTKISELLECANQYITSKQTHGIVKGLEFLKEELFSEKYVEDSKNVNKCLSNEKYYLYNCIYKHLNIEPLYPGVDQTLLKCRASLDVRKCVNLSSPCTARASHISEQLLDRFFQPFILDCSGINGREARRIQLMPLDNKYNELADCFTERNERMTQCLSKSVFPDMQLKPHLKTDHCRSVDNFIECAKDIVQSFCGNSLVQFSEISNLLKSYISPNCSVNDKLKSYAVSDQQDESFAPESYSSEFLDKSEIKDSATEYDTDAQHSVSDKLSTVEPNSKLLSTQQEDSTGKLIKEHLNNKIYEALVKSRKLLPGNTSVTPSPNVTDPIIIHKHTLITIKYVKSSASGSFVLWNSMIGIFVLSQYLYFCIRFPEMLL